MSKLSKLIGKSQTFTIAGEEFEFKSRTLKDIDLVIEMQDASTRASALKKLITATLKDAVPEATDEEIEQIGFQHFKELSDAIIKVNGLSPEDATS